MDQINHFSVSGIIANEPTAEVKSRTGSTHGIILFRITNSVKLSDTVTKENIFFINFYTKDCAAVSKEFKIGEHVSISGRLFSTGSDKTYMNINADRLGHLGDVSFIATTPETAIKLNSRQMMEEEI